MRLVIADPRMQIAYRRVFPEEPIVEVKLPVLIAHDRRSIAALPGSAVRLLNQTLLGWPMDDPLQTGRRGDQVVINEELRLTGGQRPTRIARFLRGMGVRSCQEHSCSTGRQESPPRNGGRHEVPHRQRTT